MKNIPAIILLFLVCACTENKPAAEIGNEIPAPQEQSIAEPVAQEAAPVTEQPAADSTKNAAPAAEVVPMQDSATQKLFADTANADPRVKRILDEKLLKK